MVSSMHGAFLTTKKAEIFVDTSWLQLPRVYQQKTQPRKKNILEVVFSQVLAC